MKTRLWLVLGMTSLFILSSCNEDKIISNNQLVKSISITGQDFQSGEPGTKAAYSVDGTGMHFSWTEGDTVGIYPVGGDQVAFPISSGEGSQTAQFDGGAWALRSSFSYAAYYPFSESNYHIDETKLPVSYIGQAQNGNGSLAGLDRFDYQASVATSPDASGNVNIALKHLGCFVRFQLRMPVADTYKSMTITSSKTPFITTGTFDLSSDSIQVKPKTTSQTIVVSLNNTSTTPQDSILTVFAMFAPIDLSDSELNITLDGTNYMIYSVVVSGKDMMPGKSYSFKATIQNGKNNNGNDVCWDKNGQLIQLYEYVDLGLSVNWATCNVGAVNPEDYGGYYAWGEISDKTDYSWSTYVYCKGSYSKLTKYVNTSTIGYGYNGYRDFKSIIDLDDDVVNIKWGDKWRIPSKTEIEELLANCIWTWTTLNGVNGYEVKSIFNDNTIFLPASGYIEDYNIRGLGTTARYWSNLCDDYRPSFAFSLNNDKIVDEWRCIGQSVRPVYPSETWVGVTRILMNVDSISVLVNSKYNLVATLMSGNIDCSYLGTAIWSSDNPAVASVNDKGEVSSLSVGTATITATYKGRTATCFVTVREFELVCEYVDLGLSVNWATCNVGASRPEDYGDFYAWGEIETKNDYSWSTYQYSRGTYNSLTKYCLISSMGYEGFTDEKITLEQDDDVAFMKWGGKWRTPSKQEFEELLNNCIWEWATQNGINGYKIISNVQGYSNCWIFLPASGRCAEYIKDWPSYFWSGAGSSGYYWTNNSFLGYDPFCLKFYYYIDGSTRLSLGEHDKQGERFMGYSVRPVCPKNN